MLDMTSEERQINLFFPQRRWKREMEAKSLEKLTKTNKQTNLKSDLSAQFPFSLRLAWFYVGRFTPYYQMS